MNCLLDNLCAKNQATKGPPPVTAESGHVSDTLSMCTDACGCELETLDSEHPNIGVAAWFFP